MAVDRHTSVLASSSFNFHGLFPQRCHLSLPSLGTEAWNTAEQGQSHRACHARPSLAQEVSNFPRAIGVLQRGALEPQQHLGGRPETRLDTQWVLEHRMAEEAGERRRPHPESWGTPITFLFPLPLLAVARGKGLRAPNTLSVTAARVALMSEGGGVREAPPQSW